MYRLENFEAVELLEHYPQAVECYYQTEYMICRVLQGVFGWFQIVDANGCAVTGLLSEQEVIGWFLDKALDVIGDGWEELVNV